MCYSAQVWADYTSYIRRMGAKPDIHEFVRLYVQRKEGAKVKIPRGMDLAFANPQGKDEYDPLFAINHTHAKMRSDLARLGRKSWSTTKSINALVEHLWLWVAWVNGYRLK